MESAKANLGQLDIRTSNEQNLVTAVNSFLADAMSFDEEFNKDKEKSVLKLLSKYKEKLFILLDLDWNSSLDVKHGPWLYFRPSPLKDASKFTCQHCQKEYTNARVYQDHLKAAHQVFENVPKPKVTCRLPHNDQKSDQKVMWDQMANHLSRVHKIQKPTSQHFFRGFQSFDNGVTKTVVWRKKSEADPVPPSSPKADQMPPSSPKADPVPPSDQNTSSKADPVPPSDQNTSPKAGPSHFMTDESLKISCSKNLFPECGTDPSAKSIEPRVTKNEMPSLMEMDDDILGQSSVPEPEPEKPKKRVIDLQIENDLFSAVQEPTSVPERDPEKTKKHIIEVQKEHEDFLAVYGAGEKSTPILDPMTGKSKELSIEVPIDMEKSSVSDLSDEVCADEEFEIRMALANDSDVEPDDSEEFTQRRLQNKILRYKKRIGISSTDLDPSATPENKGFIEDFGSFVSKRGISENDYTFRKSDGLLFRHQDSLLKDLIKKRPGFKLNDLVNFANKEDFVEIQDPQSWIEQIGGQSGNDNPSRMKEMYKSHKQLRDYVLRKLSEAEIGSGFMDLWWKDKIRSNLEQITKDVNSRGVWTKLESLIKVELRQKQISQESLAPNKSANEVKANAVYFSSKEYLAREEKNNLIWRHAMDTGEISEKDFNDYLNFSRHILAITDRSRQGAYSFSNQEYCNKRKCYFPKDFADKEFVNLPDIHPIFQEPEDKRPHDSLLIRLSGSGKNLKLKSGTPITVNKRAEDLLMKCRDLKDMVSKQLGKN